MMMMRILLLLLQSSTALSDLIAAEADVADVEGRRRVDVDPVTQPGAKPMRSTRQHEEEEEEEEEENEEDAGACAWFRV